MSCDKHMVAQRFAQHYGEYHHHANIQHRVATRLAEMLARSCPGQPVRRGLEVGMGTGFLSQELARLYPQAYWYYNDITDKAFDWIPEQVSRYECLLGDAEQIALPQDLQLLASASAVQWFDDLGGFLTRAHASMERGGMLALSSFGLDHMKELRALTGVGLAYLSCEQLVTLLRVTGWDVLQYDEWREQLGFPTGRAVLEHLRHTGVNALSSTPWTPRRLSSFDAEYRERHSLSNGELALTYHPLLLIARAR